MAVAPGESRAEPKKYLCFNVAVADFWSDWQPGWSEPADLVEFLGVERLSAVASDLGVTISDRPLEAQEVIVAELADCLRTGSSTGTLERRIRPIFGDNERSSATAGTLVAWAMSTATLVGYHEAGFKATWLGEDDACETCKSNTQAAPVEPGDPFPSGHPTPPAHIGCRCYLSASIDTPGSK